MATTIFKLAIIALFAIGFTLTSCDNKESNKSKSVKTDQQGKEYDSSYVCPMHCEGSGSDKMGQCPVCGMDYVENNTYACPMHEEIRGIKDDKCSKCGMDLTSISEEEHKGHNH